jgi:lipoate-protein ligase A
MEWRLLQDGCQDAYTNMAVDEVLLESKIPVLRFYRWRPPAISVGYFQKLEEEIDLAECRRQGIDWVRRITGGKAVLHDKELTYSLVITQDLMPKSIIQSYRLISRAILGALRGLGLQAQAAKRVRRPEKSSLCFNAPSYYEIITGGKKIVGSAQVRKKGKLLQHGSILLDCNIERLCSLLKGAGQVSQVRERVASLNVELGKEIAYEYLASVLKKSFEETFSVRLVPDKLTRAERMLARQLVVTKFRKKEWNYLR